jgi:uncharacterized protein YndB with AHSA1/START domain
VNSAKCTANFETLRLQRFIPASPERVFRAWTDPDEIKLWWGPVGVRCVCAEVDLRVGGRYRIGNELPDGSVLWIAGNFEVIESPQLLVYTWIVENECPSMERVKVQFEQHDPGTDVLITHERIATKALSEQHQQGWVGCLDSLFNFFK